MFTDVTIRSICFFFILRNAFLWAITVQQIFHRKRDHHWLKHDHDWFVWEKNWTEIHYMRLNIHRKPPIHVSFGAFSWVASVLAVTRGSNKEYIWACSDIAGVSVWMQIWIFIFFNGIWMIWALCAHIGQLAKYFHNRNNGMILNIQYREGKWKIEKWKSEKWNSEKWKS